MFIVGSLDFATRHAIALAHAAFDDAAATHFEFTPRIDTPADTPFVARKMSRYTDSDAGVVARELRMRRALCAETKSAHVYVKIMLLRTRARDARAHCRSDVVINSASAVIARVCC